MKASNIMKGIIIGLLGLSFSGCANHIVEVPNATSPYKKLEIQIETDDRTPGVIYFSSYKIEYNTPLEIDKEIKWYSVLSNTIFLTKEIANYGNDKGYKYFSINKGMFDAVGNDELSPITSINSNLEYCFSDLGLRSEDECYKMKSRTVKFYNEKPINIPVWNIKEVLNEKIDLSTFEMNDNFKDGNIKTYKKYLNSFGIETI
jgi:hypothetical protein